MTELWSKMVTWDWWISVFLVGLIVSVIGNFVTRRLDGLRSSANRWMRNRSEKRRADFEADVARVARSHKLGSPIYYQLEMRARSEATHALVTSIVLGGFVLLLRGQGVNDLLRLGVEIISALLFIAAFLSAIYSQLAEARAKRMEEISLAAMKVVVADQETQQSTPTTVKSDTAG